MAPKTWPSVAILLLSDIVLNAAIEVTIHVIMDGLDINDVLKFSE